MTTSAFGAYCAGMVPGAPRFLFGFQRPARLRAACVRGTWGRTTLGSFKDCLPGRWMPDRYLIRRSIRNRTGFARVRTECFAIKALDPWCRRQESNPHTPG